jgi:hypothetical protein
MSAIIEFALTILVSALWTFVLFTLRPQWVGGSLRRRVLISVIEGALCAFFWLFVLIITSNPVTLESVEVAAICGVLWAAVAAYTRGRYHTALTQSRV